MSVWWGGLCGSAYAQFQVRTNTSRPAGRMPSFLVVTFSRRTPRKLRWVVCAGAGMRAHADPCGLLDLHVCTLQHFNLQGVSTVPKSLRV